MENKLDELVRVLDKSKASIEIAEFTTDYLRNDHWEDKEKREELKKVGMGEKECKWKLETRLVEKEQLLEQLVELEHRLHEGGLLLPSPTKGAAGTDETGGGGP